MKKLLILLLVVSSSLYPSYPNHESSETAEVRKLVKKIHDFVEHPEKILDELEAEDTEEQELKTSWEAFKEAFKRWAQKAFCCKSKE